MTTIAAIAPTYYRYDVRRVLRNRRAMIFTVVMPALLYLVFGATQSRSGTVGSGNVAFYVLVGMALYGAVLAATTNAAAISLEQLAGWTRTLAMTPLRPSGYVATKVAVALTMAALPVGVLVIAGIATGAHAPVWVWIACLAIALAGAGIFAAFGLAVGSALASEGAMQVLGGVLALLAFAGNVFVPLKGTMLTIAQFTPMFGVTTLARYPLDRGVTVYGEHIALWIPVVNTAAWAAIFAAAAVFFYTRSTARR
ncbi:MULTISPECIES: ABC transporter permease [unclassified Gordonia (in: high G+C Gram-positive bacteria)]|uniref:ABC transporter permease n=1 Tax=unclassified Gordonia (in: high G+C Gram-positive bacteria) TaxID=2657482 RepID=UPI0020002101|nr:MULTISPECIES: ABC transporter permease [unclassified Gordonia (in: high G+C Gram-positive bacteria)]UQE75280.1 ABC transporter permease [Gordonia sp. PP30]